MTCKTCGGEGWVCENHRDKPWGGTSDSPGACDCGAGAPCADCNTPPKELRPRLPEGARVDFDKDGYRQ